MITNHQAAVIIAWLMSGAAAANACDTWVALSNATKDGSIILAKNSDRPPMEAQPLVHMPHRKHQAGETVQCTYIRIPQVAETYEHIGSAGAGHSDPALEIHSPL
jgi:hypothetical protein